ncbi:MAG TPA: ATP-binding protein [Candidatus Babeliales bacterium]|nr:ATP-binding protein [Candidatus Babeliales bacterium]
MIKRDLEPKLRQMAQQFPVVAVLGPRQSGKTTLTQATFSNYKYVSLEDFDAYNLANSDPRAFLALHNNEYGIILDEIQNTPELLSYIQTEVDRTQKNGFFVITGSQNFLLNKAITQTLAGRVAILTLLPLALSELKQADMLPADSNNMIFQGSYPRVYAHHNLSPADWYPNYIRTYLERDVRQIKNVSDLATFQLFMKLCAGRIGQLLNVSSLANDCGISLTTANAWISLLQVSYIIFLLQPHFKNFSKRLVKTPKLYFYDTGIACFLLELESAKQVATHYLRGGLFESYTIAELMKLRYNVGRIPHYYFWRDKMGHEVDCIIGHGGKLFPVEIKSGQTISQDYFEELHYWSNLAGDEAGRNYCIYTGSESQNRTLVSVLKWQDLEKINEIFTE